MEGLEPPSVTALRGTGHDVLWIQTDATGITDHDVLARAAPKVSRREIPSLRSSIHLRHRISRLQVARFLLFRVGHWGHRCSLARPFLKSRALNVIVGRRRRERRQIVCPDPGRRLESRGQLY